MEFERYTGKDLLATIYKSGTCSLGAALISQLEIDPSKRVGVYLARPTKQIALAFNDNGIRSLKLSVQSNKDYHVCLMGAIKELGATPGEMAGRYRLVPDSGFMLLERIAHE